MSYSDPYNNQGATVPPPQPAYYPMGHQPQEMPQVPPPQYGMAVNYGFQQPTAYSNPQAPMYSGDEPSAVPKATEDEEIFTGSFSNQSVRRAFIKKVYLILSSQLLFTFGSVALFIFVKPVKEFAQTETGFWVYIVAYILFLVLYIVLVCVKSVRRKSPGNYICLGLFTLCFSFMAAMISSYHETNIVLMAMGITAILCLAISVFAIQTKIDFTLCSGFLFVFCMVMFFFGWACLITYYSWGGSQIMSCVYSALMALLFGLFLIYDTQMIVGGRKHELSPEEYIYGALQLYVDVVYLFLIILSLFGKSS